MDMFFGTIITMLSLRCASPGITHICFDVYISFGNKFEADINFIDLLTVYVS